MIIKKGFTHQQKAKRNERLYQFWLDHPDWSYKAIAKLFHIATPRAWRLIRREANKRALGGDGQK